MEKVQESFKKVHYVTYEYDEVTEKERHIITMASKNYECLERFEDSHKVIYRKFLE